AGMDVRAIVVDFVAMLAQQWYLPEIEQGAQAFVTDMLPGVTVHALGPSHDPDVIALMDPPAGKFFPEEPAQKAGGALSDRFVQGVADVVNVRWLNHELAAILSGGDDVQKCIPGVGNLPIGKRRTGSEHQCVGGERPGVAGNHATLVKGLDQQELI